MTRILNYKKPLSELPEKLIYLRGINTAMHPAQEDFVIISPKIKKIAGVMRCHKSNMILRPDYKGDSLAIDFIQTNIREFGFGKALINFAKYHSREIGCNGHIFLKAVPFYSPKSVPHLFYRKQGFSSLDKKKDKYMDKLIKQCNRGTYKEFSDMLMFYPGIKDNKPKTAKEFLKQIYSKFMGFFNRD